MGGYSAVGRIAAVGEDATTLTPGQLVWIDCVIRGRDDPDSSYLMGIHEGRDEGSKKLSHNVWHDGAFAEYMKVPLENCIPLDEGRLCNELGYTVKDLVYLSHLLVAFGGLLVSMLSLQWGVGWSPWAGTKRSSRELKI